MGTGDRSVTDGDGSKPRSVTPQAPEQKQVTNPVTDVTDAPGKSHTRARAHAHGKVTENSVTICHLSPEPPGASEAPDADAKRYAMCDHDDPAKPVYRPEDDVLEFKRSVRFAAIDVMILTYAARRHAEWLSEIGVCPPDIAKLIRQDLAYITSVLERERQDVAAAMPASAGLGDVGPRSREDVRATTPTPTLFDATRGDVGQTEPSEVITGKA